MQVPSPAVSTLLQYADPPVGLLLLSVFNFVSPVSTQALNVQTTKYFDSFLSSYAYSPCVRAFLLKLHKLTYQLRHVSPLASRNCRADKWNFIKFGKGKFQNTFLVLTNFGSNGEKNDSKFYINLRSYLKRNSLNFVRSEECSGHFPVCYGSSNTVSFRPSACTFVLLSAVHRTASKFNTHEFRI